MVESKSLRMTATLAIVSLFASFAQAEEPDPQQLFDLRQYLSVMGNKLDCYFTFEDRPGPDGSFPWIEHIRDFERDLQIGTIDALVAKLDQELDGVKVVRSTKHPAVVHLIAEDLLQQGYVMDQTVTTEYAGLIGGLPPHLGTLREGVGVPMGGAFHEALMWDFTTEVEIAVQDETVRDVLTGAVPLEGYRTFLWVARRHEVDGVPKMGVRYFGRILTSEDLIADLEGYLREMGKRLNCYFTIEDRPDPEPEDENVPWIKNRRECHFDFEIATIDALVDHLDAELQGVKVVRSTKYPSVVHLMAEDLLQPGSVMEQQVSLEFEHELHYLPEHVGMLLDGQILIAADAAPGVFPNLRGVDTPEVQVAVQNETVRNVLTGAVPLEGHERILWMSVRVEVDGSPKVYVGYYGTSEEEEDP